MDFPPRVCSSVSLWRSDASRWPTLRHIESKPKPKSKKRKSRLRRRVGVEQGAVHNMVPDGRRNIYVNKPGPFTTRVLVAEDSLDLCRTSTSCLEDARSVHGSSRHSPSCSICTPLNPTDKVKTCRTAKSIHSFLVWTLTEGGMENDDDLLIALWNCHPAGS